MAAPMTFDDIKDDMKAPMPEQEMNDVDEDLGEEEKAKLDGKEFRFQAKCCFLTYAQSKTLTTEMVKKELEDRFGRIHKYAIGLEKHRDGRNHIHAVLQFEKKIDQKNPRLFDIKVGDDVFHPNIQKNGKKMKPHAWFMKKFWYTIKDMDYISGGIDYYQEPDRFANKMKDIEAWSNYREALTAVSPFPLTLPFDLGMVPEPPRDKCRHYIFVGPPSTGKTYWYNTILTNDGQRNVSMYLVPHASPDKIWDDYNQEELIIFDDGRKCEMPEQGLITRLTEIWNIRNVRLGARYSNKPLKKKQIRILFMFFNYKPPYWNELWFTERFNRYRWRDNKEDHKAERWQYEACVAARGVSSGGGGAMMDCKHAPAAATTTTTTTSTNEVIDLTLD